MPCILKHASAALFEALLPLPWLSIVMCGAQELLLLWRTDGCADRGAGHCHDSCAGHTMFVDRLAAVPHHSRTVCLPDRIIRQCQQPWGVAHLPAEHQLPAVCGIEFWRPGAHSGRGSDGALLVALAAGRLVCHLMLPYIRHAAVAIVTGSTGQNAVIAWQTFGQML